MKFAVLIDGGFVRRKLGSPQRPADAADIRRLVRAIVEHAFLRDHVLHRVYYYDAKPLEGSVSKPLLGGTIDFGREPLASRSQQLFLELAREPFFALRMGELSFNGWVVKPRVLQKGASSAQLEITAAALNPKITQKGVDMRVGMDIAALALKGLAGIIVLVTGDSDFVPAMKFARREGAQLFLVPLGHGVRESMREHSDLVLELPALAPSPA